MSRSKERKQENETLLAFLETRAEEAAEQLRAQKARRLATSVARDELFLRRQLAALAKIVKPVVPSKYAVKVAEKKVKQQRALNLVFSDLHFGAALDQRELPVRYGFVEEARRLAKVVRDTIEYKYDHRAETVLNVHMLGDMIQGKLHDKQDARPLAEQMADCQYLLTQAVARLSEHFPRVSVYCTPGNHGRNKDRHADRAVSEKWDAHETAIYHCVKLATKSLPNVKVSIPRTPWYAWESFGEWGFATHGDTVLNVGYPGSNIDVRKARSEVNEINSSRTYGDRRYGIFIEGHVHTASVVHLPNGSIILTNGPLIPPDGYAVSRGTLDQSCSQSLFESVPGHILGDYRVIRVDEASDRDASLNELIQSFSDF